MLIALHLIIFMLCLLVCTERRKELFKSDGFGWRDVGNHETWNNQYQHAYNQSSDIDDNKDRNVDFHRHCADIVSLWVELHDAEYLLQHDYKQCKNIAVEQSLADDECPEP